MRHRVDLGIRLHACCRGALYICIYNYVSIRLPSSLPSRSYVSTPAKLQGNSLCRSRKWRDCLLTSVWFNGYVKSFNFQRWVTTWLALRLDTLENNYTKGKVLLSIVEIRNLFSRLNFQLTCVIDCSKNSPSLLGKSDNDSHAINHTYAQDSHVKFTVLAA